MNACIRAVVRSALYFNLEVFGVYNGYQGLIDADFERMSYKSVSYIINQGGTILYTARCKDFMTPEGRAKAAANLHKLAIDGLIVIGGDGSFRGANLLHKEHGIRVIGIPATIDNDIAGTDYSLGFDTASNTAMEAIDKIRDTATSHNRLFLIEVMGRDAGYIALRCGIAVGAKAVLIPEKKLQDEELFALLRKGNKSKKKSNVIVIAEGNTNGSPFELAQKIKEKYNHFDIKVSILGHIQRGGSPSVYDRSIAARMAVEAVEGLMAAKSGVMVGLLDNQLKFTAIDATVGSSNEIDNEMLRIANILSI